MAMSGTLSIPALSFQCLDSSSSSSALSGRQAPASALKVSSRAAFNGGVRIQVAPGAAARAPQWRSLEVAAMAKREQQLVEIRQMDDESIGRTVTDLKGELFVLRCKQATRQEYKSSDFRKIRKQIARMLTVRREKEIERGISMRESRKLDREWKKNVVIRPPASLESLNKSSSVQDLILLSFVFQKRACKFRISVNCLVPPGGEEGDCPKIAGKRVFTKRS